MLRITDITSLQDCPYDSHNIDHGLNRIVKLKINGTGGSDYGTGGGSVETYYNANLVSIGASTTGSNATAKVTVSAAGTISEVTIMDGGKSTALVTQCTLRESLQVDLLILLQL